LLLIRGKSSIELNRKVGGVTRVWGYWSDWMEVVVMLGDITKALAVKVDSVRMVGRSTILYSGSI
jgi:hypothetical protein